MKLFTSVGKKFILLLCCSILIVYKGVFVVQELAVVNTPANNTATKPITANDTFFLFVLSPPFVRRLVVMWWQSSSQGFVSYSLFFLPSAIYFTFVTHFYLFWQFTFPNIYFLGLKMKILSNCLAFSIPFLHRQYDWCCKRTHLCSELVAFSHSTAFPISGIQHPCHRLEYIYPWKFL